MLTLEQRPGEEFRAALKAGEAFPQPLFQHTDRVAFIVE
jgi:hypothetical protein